MRFCAGVSLILLGCARSFAPASSEPVVAPEIASFTLSPSLITEGDPVEVRASFTGGDAVLSIDGEAQPMVSDSPMSMVLTRHLGGVYEERQLLLRVTSASGEVVESRQKLTLVPQAVTPVLTAPAKSAPQAAAGIARVEPVLGMRYEWSISGGHFESPAIGTTVTFRADGVDPVQLSVSALNPLSVRSAAVSVSVTTQSLTPLALDRLPLSDAALLSDGAMVYIYKGELFRYDAALETSTSLLTTPLCFGSGIGAGIKS